jgi:hypothetical protein
MTMFADPMSGLGALLLPVVAGLLLEELTLGGLVRLLLAPRPKTRKSGAHTERPSSPARGREELKRTELGGARCSH